jgi:hypothetical protein
MKNVISLKVRILGSNLFLTREYFDFSVTYLLEFELFVKLKRFKTFNTTVCVYFQFFGFF